MDGDLIRERSGGQRLLRVTSTRGELVPLLRLADDSEQAIEGYHQRGDAFALLQGEVAQGVILCTPLEEGWAPRAVATVELKNIAVLPELRGRGLGAWMLTEVIAALREQGVRRVCLATATAGTRQLRFYQRLGFRFLRIERDWFCAERGYADGLVEEGIPLRDRIWLDRDL